MDIKEEAEKWFTKQVNASFCLGMRCPPPTLSYHSMAWQATGLLGKKFLEKVKCKKFFDYMDKQHPGFMDSNENKLNVMSTVRFCLYSTHICCLCQLPAYADFKARAAALPMSWTREGEKTKGRGDVE